LWRNATLTSYIGLHAQLLVMLVSVWLAAMFIITTPRRTAGGCSLCW
jgi:hypothetical protein